MFGHLKLMNPAPISEPISSRDSNAYLLETLRFSGLNLWNDFGVGRKIWRVFSFTYNMLILPVSFPINYTIHLAEFPPDLLLQSLQLCLNTWCFALKYFTLVIYMHRLELANKHFDEMDMYCVKPEEKRKMRDMVAVITRLYLIFIVVYVLYATSTLVDGLFHDRVPFNTYYPFVNWRVDRTQLYIQSFLEFFTVGYAIFVATATDSYPVIFVAALRCHILLLKDRIVNLGEVSNETHSDPNFMFKSLVDCIKAHRTMLNFCEAIRPIISGTIFAQFVICGSILGIIMINMVLFADQSTRFGIITYVMAVLLQTFPLCFYCNAIVDDCNELADALFHSAWWMQDKRYQRTALQFLQKLQQPMTFTAMNIFNINLATNINVSPLIFERQTKKTRNSCRWPSSPSPFTLLPAE
ncbi:odorant receptor 43b isoform X1 [Drosophila eugracilis]|uniref:odorant receptor 43b isoform X1 n=1 Tax=Drosophila eugracilis TaxID=29029 RepID=UPI0007E880EB|nr:odorant receptor 43b isoform X1 [Drosophila eugracilis]